MQERSENEVIFKSACGLVVKFWMSNFGLGSNLGHSSFTRSVILESASSSCAIHHHQVCTLVNGHPPIILCTSAYLLVLTYSCVLVLTGMHWSMVTHQPSCVLVPTSTTTTLYAVTINSTSYYPLVLLPANTSTATGTRFCTKTNIKSPAASNYHSHHHFYH